MRIITGREMGLALHVSVSWYSSNSNPLKRLPQHRQGYESRILCASKLCQLLWVSTSSRSLATRQDLSFSCGIFTSYCKFAIFYGVSFNSANLILMFIRRWVWCTYLSRKESFHCSEMLAPFFRKTYLKKSYE